MSKAPIDPETLKIPAFLRKKTIVSQAKQQLILTALDRKQAGLPPNSKTPVAKAKKIADFKKPNPLLATLEKIRTEKKQTVRSTHNPDSTDLDLAIEASRQQGKIRKSHALAFFPKEMQQIGIVTDYWEKIGVAGIKLDAQINKNNFVLIETESGLFKQSTLEMQIDRQPILTAPSGSHIGLKVEKKPSINGKVYKLS